MSTTYYREYPVYDRTENTDTFIAFRTNIAGTGNNSALTKIDADMHTALTRYGTIPYVSLNYDNSSNLFIGSIEHYELAQNSCMVIAFNDVSHNTAIKININGVADNGIELVRYNDKGIASVTDTDLIANKRYFVIYNGDYYVILNAEVTGTIVEFDYDVSDTLNNIQTRDTMQEICKKIRHWFSKLGTLAFKNTVSALTDVSSLAAVATSGDYNDLTNKPIALKNPTALTFGNKTYDGSVAASLTAGDIGALTAQSTLDTTKLDATKAIPDGVTATTQAKTDNSAKLATTAFVTTKVNDVLEASKAMTYEGVVPSTEWTAGLTNHTVGDTYMVAQAGTYVGVPCDIGDIIICKTSRQSADNGDWNIIHQAGGGVTGPSSSTNNHVALFNGTTGNVLKDGGALGELASKAKSDIYTYGTDTPTAPGIAGQLYFKVASS